MAKADARSKLNIGNPHPWIEVVPPGPKNPHHVLYRCHGCVKQENLPTHLSEAVRKGALLGFRGEHKDCGAARAKINHLHARGP